MIALGFMAADWLGVSTQKIAVHGCKEGQIKFGGHDHGITEISMMLFSAMRLLNLLRMVLHSDKLKSPAALPAGCSAHVRAPPGVTSRVQPAPCKMSQPLYNPGKPCRL